MVSKMEMGEGKMAGRQTETEIKQEEREGEVKRGRNKLVKHKGEVRKRNKRGGEEDWNRERCENLR